jgi:hypothetical protein
VSLKADEILKSFKQHGTRVAIISFVSAIALGVTDQFTSKIVPSLVEKIEYYFVPPKFFITFSPPVDVSGGLTVSPLETQDKTPVSVSESVPGTRIFTALAVPGTYIVRLRGGADKAGLELVDSKKIDKSGETWKVDASERNWASAVQLRTGAPRAPAPDGKTTLTEPGASRLSGTRWTAAEQDFALIASAEPGLLRSTLANALAEVGVFEKGTDQEKRRIVSYWGAAGPGWSHITVQNLTTPWGGAFLAWVVRQAGANAPKGPALFLNWQNWDDKVSSDLMAAGMIAIFRLDLSSDLPQAPSRRLAGVVVRRQPSCIEIVAGNVADRVVITCVAAQAMDSIRRPRLPSVGE